MEDSLYFLGQNAQDPLIGLDEPWSPDSGMLTIKSKKRKSKRTPEKNETPPQKQQPQSLVSFVVNNQVERGLKLIKIEVIDLTDNESASASNNSEGDGGKVLLSAQYVVKDCIDDVLDQTESLITNISKKVCGYNF